MTTEKQRINPFGIIVSTVIFVIILFITLPKLNEINEKEKKLDAQEKRFKEIEKESEKEVEELRKDPDKYSKKTTEEFNRKRKERMKK